MKIRIRFFILLVLMLCEFTQITFGDVIIPKDAIGPVGVGMLAVGGLLLIAAAIAIIWVVSLVVIKSVRNKNVNK